MHKRQVTLADIAKKLNISTATVSRALKNYPDISDETKRRVLALANELNYRPNSIAAGLRKRESKIIGVIIPEIVNHFFSSVIKGIMEVAYDGDYRVMLCQSDESFDKEVTDANALFASRVDGLLVSLGHETKTYEHFLQFQESGIPLVFFDKVADQLKTSQVIVDDYEGAFQAVSHLISEGCSSIAHFAGPLVASTSRKRLNGYKDALAHHGISLREEWVIPCEDITLEEGSAFVNRFHKANNMPEGIFAITDSVAIGAIDGLKKLGYQVPSQVAVAGFSDWKISSVINPSLTSVSQPSFEMGTLAAKILLEEIQKLKDEEEIEEQVITLKTQLKIRESSLFTTSRVELPTP
ncbi:MAG: LacI family DNA-binding transcriptional regulator [Bacteroidota bacterium]